MVLSARLCAEARGFVIRRVGSIILFVLGGWVLAAEMMMASADVGQSPAIALAMIGIMLAFAAIILLLGLWASPGNRLAELGATLIAAAMIGGLVVIMLFILLSDPEFVMLLPASSQPFNFRIAPIPGFVNVLIIGAAGWWLYRRGAGRSITPR
jgi:hypothetical protein